MNYCKFYNKTMNAFEEILYKLLSSNEKRRNVEEINVILGTIYIIITIFFVIIGLILYCPIKTMQLIYKHTNSKCSLKKESDEV